MINDVEKLGMYERKRGRKIERKRSLHTYSVGLANKHFGKAAIWGQISPCGVKKKE